jgi:hypothetical protein
MITFFLNEENCIRVIVVISMKGSRIRIVMLFCILDVIFSVKEIFLFYSPSPEYPVARAAQALAPRVLRGASFANVF